MEKLPEYSPQPNQRLAFMQEFDGSQIEPSADEKNDVADGFNSFVEDIMLNHIEGLSKNNYDPSEPMATLVLRVPSEHGNWRVTVGSLKSDRDNAVTADFAPRFIELNSSVGAELAYESHEYFLDTDGVVRRFDTFTPKRISTPIPLEANEEEENRLFWEKVSDNDNLEESQALETAMGLNKQPIGKDELTGLIGFLTIPSIEVESQRTSE